MLNQNTYIMSFQAKTLKYAMSQDSKAGYVTKGKKKNKLYSCSVPYSLDVIHLSTLDKNVFYQNIVNGKEKQYSDAIVNVSFKDPYFEKMEEKKTCCSIKKGKPSLYQKRKSKVISDVLELREKLYKDGFTVNGNKHYVLYKRSSSKARLGSCLFILKKYHDKMLEWSRMGLTFNKNEECDLASMKAYESLTLSAIAGTLEIKPEQILLINDVTGYYDSISSVMTLSNGEPQIKTDEHYPNHSDIWDGQSLLDERKFSVDKNGKQKGMMLLRNRFFKSCAFNTKLQKFFQDKYCDEYETKIIQDMCGNDRKVTDIRLVITPNSLKIFKFQDKLGGRDACYKYWLDKLETTFGICKSEKKSHYDTANQLSYQMINSMNFSLEDMKELISQEVKYVMALKNDLSVFVKHISDYSLSPSREFIANLLAINSDTQYTDLFKVFRTKTIHHYKENLKCGKIKISNCDYGVLFSNPYEMLRAAVGDKITDTLHHKLEGQPHGTEVYCSKFKDGEDLFGFRNPHICAGNCAILKNKKFDEFNYFNLTANIIIINTYDNDLADRLQGADEDSDVLLYGNNKLIYQKALECQSFPTPIKNIDLDTKKYIDTPENNAKIDDIICSNDIGNIVNWSRLLNSYYWDLKTKNKTEYLSTIYDKVSMLSSMSQLAIDRAKKYYSNETLDVNKQLNKLANLEFVEIGKKPNIKKSLLSDEEKTIQDSMKKIAAAQLIIDSIHYSDDEKINAGKIKKEKLKLIEATNTQYSPATVQPQFVKIVGNDTSIPVREFQTPMDYLQIALKQEIKGKKPIRKHVDLTDLLSKFNTKNVDYRQANIIIAMAIDCKRRINAIYHLKKNKYEKEEDKALIKNNLADDLSNIKINKDTMGHIVLKLYTDSETTFDNPSNSEKPLTIKDIQLMLYSALWDSHKKEMQQCFIANSGAKIPKLESPDLLELEPELQFFGKQFMKIAE